MKTIAIITPSTRDFRMYVTTNNVTEKEINYVHVSCLNDTYSVKANDYVSLTNSAKMHNLNGIIQEINKRIQK